MPVLQTGIFIFKVHPKTLFLRQILMAASAFVYPELAEKI